MTIVLTLCSANFLAHAKCLGDSVKEKNPDCHFVIGLVDRVPTALGADYWRGFELVPVEDLRIPEFADMEKRYNIVELNTAVKPFYMSYLFDRNPSAESVIYLDPDVLVLGSFQELLSKLRNYNIVVTPHCCTYDNSTHDIHYEITMLCTGIYNLGFIATSRSETTFAFLSWWQTRLLDHCYYHPGSGVFVDQQWVSLAPLYFDGVHVEKGLGYNMCYWNHFERKLTKDENGYLVNGKHVLVFYHFSSYNPLNPNEVANRNPQLRVTFTERPDLKSLYDDYRQRLLNAGYASVVALKCVFGRQPVIEPPKSKWPFRMSLQAGVRRLLYFLPKVMRRRLERAARFVADTCGSSLLP